jgi:hypothetical protein
MKQQESFVPYLRASNGKSLQFNIDGGSLERAQYADHFVKHVLGLRASHSVIVRRALELYIAHLSKAATREQMEELHRLVAEALLEYMNMTPPAKRRASMLDVIRMFLKDNRIQADGSAESLRAGLERLKYFELPFPADDSDTMQ